MQKKNPLILYGRLFISREHYLLFSTRWWRLKCTENTLCTMIQEPLNVDLNVRMKGLASTSWIRIWKRGCGEPGSASTQASKIYLSRHNNVAKQIQLKLAILHYIIKETTHRQHSTITTSSSQQTRNYASEDKTKKLSIIYVSIPLDENIIRSYNV